MNNLPESLEQKSGYQAMYANRSIKRRNHWLDTAREYSESVFGNNLENVDRNHCINVIKMSGGIFDRLITLKKNNPEHIIEFCQAIFDYCEMSLDWREVGNWLKEELDRIDLNPDNNDQNIAWLYFAYGRYLEETGKLNLSLQYHQRGIEVSQVNNDELHLALNSLGCGVTLQRFTEDTDIKKAIIYLEQALFIFNKLDNFYQQSNTLLNLGSCYDRLEQWENSIQSYQQSIQILEKLNNRFDFGRVLYSLGIVYLRNNNFKKAEEVFHKGQQFCEETQNIYYRSLIYYGMGWLEYIKNNFETAQNYLEIALIEFTKYKEESLKTSQVSFFETEGNLYILAGASYCKTQPIDQVKVNNYLNKAESAFKQLDHFELKLMNVLANRARLHEYQKNWDEAINLFSELFEKGKRFRKRKIMSDAIVHLVRIYQQNNSSVIEWITLIFRVGLLGFFSLILGVMQRQTKFQKITQYLNRKGSTEPVM